MKRNLLAGFLNYLILVFIAIMIIVLATLPILVEEYFRLAGLPATNTLMLNVFLYLTAIPFLVLLVFAKRLARNILRGDPFCESSVAALNVISVTAFIDFMLYAVGTIAIFKNLLALTLMVAAFMVGLVSLILAQLVRAAIEIKRENDLTI